MNRQSLLTILILLFIIGILSFVVINSKQPSPKINPQDAKIVYYYGNTCPHCLELEKWMEENDIDSKIKIAKKEVYQNSQNSLELEKVANNCDIPSDQIYVPFLLTEEGKCLIGVPDITAYLESKAGLE